MDRAWQRWMYFNLDPSPPPPTLEYKRGHREGVLLGIWFLWESPGKGCVCCTTNDNQFPGIGDILIYVSILKIGRGGGGGVVAAEGKQA